MSYEIDAIYTRGTFHPLEPLKLPEGMRVHLHIEENHNMPPQSAPSRISSPRLVHPEQAADFQMEIQEINDAGV